jgi:methyl-accepting chemotaxis protein
MLIIGSFATILLFCVGIGGFSIAEINAVNATSRSLAGEINGVTILGNMSTLAQQLRALEVLEHNATSDDQRASYEAESQAAQQAFSAAWSSYAPMVSGAQEHDLAHQLRQAWQHFLAVEGQAQTLDAGGEPDLAGAVIANDFSTDSARFSAIVAQVLADRESRAAAAAAASAAVGQQARNDVAAALAAMALFTLAISGIIVSKVSKPISAMTRVMRRLANQDLSVEIPGLARGDEIGSMAQAVEVFKNNALRAAALEGEQQAARAAARRSRAQRRRASIYPRGRLHRPGPGAPGRRRSDLPPVNRPAGRI